MSRAALSFIVFATGAAILALEILASRYMLPGFGTSIFIWGAILSITSSASRLATVGEGCWATFCRNPTSDWCDIL